MPSFSNLHLPDDVMDPQPDNRLSVVSAVSLEPRRRSRHHQSRHSHVLRDLAHMLSVSSRDANELRRGLNAAFDKLDQSRARASHAEKLALDMLLRVREAEDERTNAMREASTAREELGKHKALLDSAHGEIRRAQLLLQDQDNLRYEAEASAARARDSARQMKQRRVIELAREQGRRMGYNEGIQAGQRIGYYGGQDPGDNEAVVLSNEGHRFREEFDASRYNLDDLEEPPPLRDIHLNFSHHLEVPSLAPLAARQVYHDSQGQRDEVANPADDATILPPMASYTPISLPGRVQHTVSTDSSSTTTLPAASVYVSSRAPPALPTIPEVASSEVVGTASRARTPGGSLRGSRHILPVLAPQGSTHIGVPPSPSGSAAFQPHSGSVEDIPSALVDGYTGGTAPIYAPSPRSGFNDASIVIADDGIVPGVPRSPVQERFATPGRNQTPSREHFATLGRNQTPAREHFAATPRSPLQERLATIYSPRAIHVSELQDREFPETASNRPVRCFSPTLLRLALIEPKVGSTPRRDGPPKRRPIPQMPAPLAPMSYPNVPYSSGSRVTTRRRRPSESDNGISRDASFNANPNWPRSSSQVMPNSIERSVCRVDNTFIVRC
jgi:flagellar biosynthesis/type III secretory pathway protein FliH